MTVQPKLTFSTSRPAAHRLFLLPAGPALPTDLPEHDLWTRLLKRKDCPPATLAKTPRAADLADGARGVLVMIDAGQARFERLTVLRKAFQLLADESPGVVAIHALLDDDEVLADALYVALVNGVPLPCQKRATARGLKEIRLSRRPASAGFCAVLARANWLARELITLPPNALDPARYRARLRALAKDKNLTLKEYDFRQLRKLGAGAFCAVAQGSNADSAGGDAAIVRLSWRPGRKTSKSLALVGKGICFDTGGHNLKPGRFMTGMHKDMGGSAVALAVLVAAAELELPIAIDCWLAIARNDISPAACVPGDIVTALDGTTIELVHTDAEGRLVLADTLVLAAREKPGLLIDFATLTGSMKTALGRRYAGVFASTEALAVSANLAGWTSGERVCVFPRDDDYASALDSDVADIKQCTLEGEADHILAACFLGRFVGATPWLHMDLAATTCPGGLGAVASDVTGFGVSWGLSLLRSWAETP